MHASWLSLHHCRTECFFNKDGNWYYAGIYQSFRLEDLCPQEWECLSPEASRVALRALIS